MIEGEEKVGLYRWDHQENTTKDIQRTILGKRPFPDNSNID